mgnify:CR=1 FL=1
MPKTRERSTMEIYTGAGTIFGASGGVMEAALRTAYFVLAGEELKDPDIKIVRGHTDAVVEATIPVPIKKLGGKVFEVRVCVVNGALQGLEGAFASHQGRQEPLSLHRSDELPWRLRQWRWSTGSH